ncbi:MAG: NAD-dependent epimerase/dehydratase family protein [Acidobacteriota bacterium]
MRVLFTGASSAPGKRVLRCLLEHPDYSEIWCGIHRRELPVKHPKLHKFDLDLASEVHLDQIPAPLDLAIHFAAVTHAPEESAYWNINLSGTQRLVEAARALGCRRFFYVSTRCATTESGVYGESKFAAEAALQKLDWQSLIIVRPAEVYGAGAREGVDGFVRLASKLHVVPLLWGHKGIQFAPIHIDDLVEHLCGLLMNNISGVLIANLCGPEKLNGVALALRLARRYKALPIPIWFSGLALMLKVFRTFGWSPVAPDQLARLVGPKTATSSSVEFLAGSDQIRFPERASG